MAAPPLPHRPRRNKNNEQLKPIGRTTQQKHDTPQNIVQHTPEQTPNTIQELNPKFKRRFKSCMFCCFGNITSEYKVKPTIQEYGSRVRFKS